MSQAVFLDRDGVINEEVDLLHRADQLRLIEGSGPAIARFNRAGIPVIVVTNQPVVARGLCTEKELEGIHERLADLLSEHEARWDALYYCPYHENADLLRYRRESEDRKPNPGMLLKGAKAFGLDLPQCFMVGDRTVDILAGQRVGCRTVLVQSGFGGKDGKCDVEPDETLENLLEFAELFFACQTDL